MRNFAMLILVLTLFACSTAPKSQVAAEKAKPAAKPKDILFLSDQRLIPLNFPEKTLSSWIDSTVVDLETILPSDSVPRNVWISVLLRTDGNHVVEWTANPDIPVFSPVINLESAPIPQYKDFRILFIFNRFDAAETRAPKGYMAPPEDTAKREFFLMSLEDQNRSLMAWCNETAMPLFIDGMQEVVQKVPALEAYMDTIAEFPDTLSVEDITIHEKRFWMADAEFMTDRPLLQYLRVLMHVQKGEYDKARSVYSSFQEYAQFITPLSLIVQDAIDYINIMSRQVIGDLKPTVDEIESGNAEGAKEAFQKVLQDYPRSALTNHYLLMQEYPQYYLENREEDFARLYREKVFRQCDPLFMDSYPSNDAMDVYRSTRLRINLFHPMNQFSSELDYYFISGQLYMLLDAPGYAAHVFRRGMERAVDEDVKHKFYLLYIDCLHKLGITEMNYESEAFPIPETLVAEAESLYRSDIVAPVESEVDSMRSLYESVAHLYKGVALFQADTNPEAKRELSLYIEHNADLPEAFVARGRIYLEEDIFQLAEHDFTRAIELDDTQPLYFYLRSTSFAMQRKWIEAINDINTYMELEPENHYALLLRGIYYQDARKFEESIRDLSWLINQYPDFDEAWLNRGTSYFLNGEDGFALKDMDYYLNLKPDNDFALSQRAAILLRLDQPEKALPDIEKAIELRSDKGFYYKLKGDILVRMNDNDAAIRWYLRALQEDDYAHSTIDYFLAHAYYNKQDYANAIRYIDDAIKLQPENADYHRMKASYLHDSGELEKALKELNNAIELDPENALYYSFKAAYLSDMDQDDEALATYLHSYQLAPEDMSILLSYIELLIITGNYSEAESHLQTAFGKTKRDEQIVIALFLEVVAQILQDKPFDEARLNKYLYDGLSLEWWSFEMMQNWLPELPMDKRQYIANLIDRLEEFRK